MLPVATMTAFFAPDVDHPHARHYIAVLPEASRRGAGFGFIRACSRRSQKPLPANGWSRMSSSHMAVEHELDALFPRAESR
jgi:hypothetical protein